MRIPQIIRRFGLLLVLLLSGLYHLQAQQKQVQQGRQLWLGYMTSGRLTERFSVWNDFHLIPGGFGVARTGLTTHLPYRLDVTAGYAHVWLPVAGKLRRHEHRPWAQLALPTSLGGNIAIQHRLRWDMRYRQRLVGGEIGEGYTFNHRVRVQALLRRNFPQLSFGGILPSLVLADELLMNLGRQAPNAFDQNRLSLMAGFRHDSLQLQTGYMNRFVQSSAPGSYTSNHTLVIWLFHTFDLRKTTIQP